jgi:opacity protein-like surface antigen
MKKYFVTIALTFALIANAQQPSKDLVIYERFIAEAGIRIPLDKLADKIGPSPEFGLWFRSQMPNNDMIDVGFTLYAPTNRRGFIYLSDKETYTVKPAAVSGMAGVRFNKLYALGGSRLKNIVEWSTTAGYAFFMYNDENIRAGRGRQNAESNNVAKALSTFQIGQGIKFDISNIGFQMHYNYTPYGLLSNHVSDDFGAHSITIGILYRQ